MIQRIIYTLAVIGVIALLISIVRITSARFFLGYEAQAVEEFGDPEAIKAIAELYVQIESSPHDPGLKEVDDNLAKFPKIRQVPRSWLPKRFAQKWGDDIGAWRKVYAYYDDSNNLVGIEFFGSRYGCFASRDSTRCPSWYSSLRRVAEKPIYVATRFSVE